MPPTLQICFVCLGNIVRSPLAENLFVHLTNEAGVLEKFEVSSSGTGAYHVGESPDPRMRRVAASHGYKYDGRARQFTKRDMDHFDLIIAMDLENMIDLETFVETAQQRNKIHLLREFDPQGYQDAIVPDPYYGGINGFEETYQIIERSVRGLIKALEERNQQF